MSAEHNTWRRIESLFAELTELHPDQRTAFLDSSCAANPALRAELVSLLAAHDDAGDFLTGLDSCQVAGLIDEADSQPAEKLIGQFELVREIGRGGMGVVYLAKRVDGHFEQTVALKLVKQGLFSGNTRQRFLAERQILAQLHHPNIARLLDGGVSDNNRPWFAMEYIKGMPLTRYCDKHKLGIASRLQLFIKVCHAVQHAHKNNIIHRDLKPSNILVTDDKEVKLLDFGVAEILGDEEAVNTGHPETPVRNQLFTPVYAAPEQVCNEPVTTSTDIYSLGIILYELLVGVRPYEMHNNSRDNLEKIIRNTVPETPSTRLSNMAKLYSMQDRNNANIEDRPDNIRILAANRNIPLRRFLRKFRRDLDSIIMTALQKEPARRYQSVTMLEQDVENYLQGRPVSSRADSVFCRISKFIQRHKLAATSVTLALVMTITSSILFMHRLQPEILVAEKAETIHSFITDILQSTDPATSGAARTVSLKMLDIAARQLQLNSEAFEKHPDMEASLQHSMGKQYLLLGNLDKAIIHLRTATVINSRIDGHGDLAEYVELLARVRRLKSDYDRVSGLSGFLPGNRKEKFGLVPVPGLSFQPGPVQTHHDTGKFSINRFPHAVRDMKKVRLLKEAGVDRNLPG